MIFTYVRVYNCITGRLKWSEFYLFFWFVHKIYCVKSHICNMLKKRGGGNEEKFNLITANHGEGILRYLLQMCVYVTLVEYWFSNMPLDSWHNCSYIFLIGNGMWNRSTWPMTSNKLFFPFFFLVAWLQLTVILELHQLLNFKKEYLFFHLLPKLKAFKYQEHFFNIIIFIITKLYFALGGRGKESRTL